MPSTSPAHAATGLADPSSRTASPEARTPASRWPLLRLSRAELWLLPACGVACVLALFGPVLLQDPHYHAFADHRTMAGIPFAMDVLSNLPFALFGLWGLVWSMGAPHAAIAGSQRGMAVLFFAGLLTTAVGSTAYHWPPDDLGLLFDRWGMLAAFAGLVGLAVDSRVGPRAGRAMAGVILAGGLVSAAYCYQTGDLLPWAVLQGGGMLLVVGLAFAAQRPGALAVSLGAVIAIYAVAKLLESADALLYAGTGQWVSGHTLKHLVASAAALPLLRALHAARRGRGMESASESVVAK